MSTGNTGATGDLTNIYGYLQGPKGDPGKFNPIILALSVNCV